MFTWHMYSKSKDGSRQWLQTISREAAPFKSKHIVLRIDGVPVSYIIREVTCSSGEYAVVVSLPDPKNAERHEFTPPNSTKASRYGI